MSFDCKGVLLPTFNLKYCMSIYLVLGGWGELELINTLRESQSDLSTAIRKLTLWS